MDISRSLLFLEEAVEKIFEGIVGGFVFRWRLVGVRLRAIVLGLFFLEETFEDGSQRVDPTGFQQFADIIFENWINQRAGHHGALGQLDPIAILAADGFDKRSEKRGVIHYLALDFEARAHVDPLIEEGVAAKGEFNRGSADVQIFRVRFPCHFFPWNAIFHGMNSTWFWAMCAPGPLSGYAPDLTNLPFFASRTEALKTIKTGVGKLLLNSKRVNDGIAVHFSETSRIADALYAADGGDRCEAYSHALMDVNRALEYAGLQYQYLSYDQVAQGELAKQGYKVFIMPHSRSVSDAECKAIREFVQNGGVVIADILPAILNGHGTPQAKSLLADLFPSLPTEASAKAGDKLPIVNSIGKGKTALIGNRLNDCRDQQTGECDRAERGFGIIFACHIRLRNERLQ